MPLTTLAIESHCTPPIRDGAREKEASDGERDNSTRSDRWLTPERWTAMRALFWLGVPMLAAAALVIAWRGHSAVSTAEMRWVVYRRTLLVQATTTAAAVLVVGNGILGAPALGITQWDGFSYCWMGAFLTVCTVVSLGALRGHQSSETRFAPRTDAEIWLLLVVGAGAAVSEEVVFRGYVMRWLAGLGDRGWTVIVIAAVLFAVPHANQGASAALVALALGVLFGGAYVAAGVLWAPIGLHLALNLGLGASRAANRRRQRHIAESPLATWR